MGDSLVRAQDIESGAISNVHIKNGASISASKINTSSSTNLVSQIIAGTNIVLSGGDGSGHGAVVVSAVNLNVMEYRDEFIATVSQTVFTLVSATYFLGGTNLKVYVNGVLKKLTTDYTEYSTSQVVFVAPMSGGELVTFVWAKGLGATTTDYVDGFHASATPSPNKLLALDVNAHLNKDAIADQSITANKIGLTVPAMGIGRSFPKNFAKFNLQQVVIGSSPSAILKSFCTDGIFAYVFCGDNNLYVVNIDTMTVVRTVALGWSFNGKPIILNDKIYGVASGSVKSIDIATFLVVNSTGDAKLSLYADDVTYTDGTYLYVVALGGGSTVYVQKWAVATLTKITECSVTTITSVTRNAVCFDGKYIYMAQTTTGYALMRVVNTTTMAQSGTHTCAYETISYLFTDGAYVYGIFTPGAGSPLVMEKINPATLTSVSTWAYETNESSLGGVAFDGKYYYSYVLGSGGIHLIAKHNCEVDVTVRIGSANITTITDGIVQVDSDGQYVFIMTETTLLRKLVRSLLNCPSGY